MNSPTPPRALNNIVGSEMEPELELLELLADALLASRRYTTLTLTNPNEGVHNAAQWQCVETWVSTLTELHLAALRALPQDLHVLL